MGLQTPMKKKKWECSCLSCTNRCKRVPNKVATESVMCGNVTTTRLVHYLALQHPCCHSIQFYDCKCVLIWLKWWFVKKCTVTTTESQGYKPLVVNLIVVGLFNEEEEAINSQHHSQDAGWESVPMLWKGGQGKRVCLHFQFFVAFPSLTMKPRACNDSPISA